MLSKLIRHIVFLFTSIVFVSACTKQTDTIFKIIPPSHSQVHFSNIITETEDFNILNFHYTYNGGGIGVADFNKDGLPDLVFSGNQVSSKIYLNQGDFVFKDISDAAGFSTKDWITGVSIVDINNDGWEDIYLSVGGINCQNDCYNLLYLHQGLNQNNIPTFKESAESYNLNDGLYTQQATFLDYDKDGDLDVYLLHNVIDKRDKNAPSAQQHINPNSKDQLLRNDNNTFVDVSDKLRIEYRGYGLGIAIEDFNRDGWPDIYIANDFLSSDLVYLNKGGSENVHNGFEEVGKTMLKHQSYNSMGVDIADISQDGLPDVFVVDMMPEYHERQKTMLGFMNYNKFMLSLKEEYAPQFIRNTLQIHNGFLENDLLPFSEVGYLSEVYNTDWSWTPLMADFDNDGDRDIFVSNGYGKDITDLDFINFTTQANAFGSKRKIQQHLFETIQKMEEVRMPNFIYENEGNLKFINQSGQWIPDNLSISNGAVYADLDQDGDLDLIVNNIDDPAFILENQIEQKQKNNFLRCSFEGPAKNKKGFNSQIFLHHEGKTQYHYQSPVRGYLSCVEPVAHFGIGAAEQIDSLVVVWSDGKKQVLREISSNQTISLRHKDAGSASSLNETSPTILKENTVACDYIHQENIFHDFDSQRLLLHQHSRQGPCIEVANLDNQFGDELFIGGAKGYASQIGMSTKNGYSWTKLEDTKQEAVGAAFFDFEQDGDQDLYIVYGGSEFYNNKNSFQDQLYLNDGAGRFEKRTDLLPVITSSGSCVKASDFDKDGDIDLFVGGRVMPRKYPYRPESYLLVNQDGKFTKMTENLAPELKTIGMVCDATWVDINQDGFEDLAIVGEWMPFTLFLNNNGKLKRTLQSELDHTKGLWNCISTADFDKDGDADFVLGNLGLNSRLKANTKEPLTLYAKDFDENGSPDPLIGQFYTNKKGQKYCYPIHSRDDVVSQITQVKTKYVKYADFGNATFEEILQTNIGAEDQLLANELKSLHLENQNGTFNIQPLPLKAQTAPIQDMLITDVNDDTYMDILLVGNDFTAEKNGGWYDAQNGTILLGDGKNNFKSMTISESGFYVPGDARSISQLQNSKNQTQIIVGQNNGPVKIFDYE